MIDFELVSDRLQISLLILSELISIPTFPLK